MIATLLGGATLILRFLAFLCLTSALPFWIAPHSCQAKQATSRKLQTKDTAPAKIITIDDLNLKHLRHLPPAQRPAFARHLASIGFYLNVPEFWDNLNDPVSVLNATYTYGEPVGSHALVALRRTYPRFTDADELYRLRAALILYRYGDADRLRDVEQMFTRSRDPDLRMAAQVRSEAGGWL